jgi:hypothetical protein
MSTADVSLQALRHVMVGDVPAAFVILTEHIGASDLPAREMFAIAWGYATTPTDDDLAVFDGLTSDGADLARSLVVASRTGDILGGWMVWQLADVGSCGAALGGLLAAAAGSVLRRMGE